MLEIVGLLAWFVAGIAVCAIVYGIGIILYRKSRVFREKLDAFYTTLPQYWESEDE